MRADRNTIVDGQNYKAGDEIPDLGNWECIEVEGNKRHYAGFSNQIHLLPKYPTLGTGSTASCYDNGAYLKFHSKTNEWYPQD
jgi:hypothetical protein